MKNILKSSLLLGGLVLLTACNDDIDSNPVLGSGCYPMPESFVLNTPSYSTQDIDLERSTTLALSWSQPKYGFPAVPTYSVELSSTGNFTTNYTEDEDGNVVGTPDFITLDETVSGQVSGKFTSSEIDIALEKLNGWKSESDIPASSPTYVRMRSALVSSSGSEYGVVYSNIVKLNTLPYYEALTNADPNFWYLIGACIGDGKWTNTSVATGVSNMPMFTVDEAKYDAKTGDGDFEYVGWFPNDASFKIVQYVGSWDYGICADGEYRNGGDDPGNITIGTAGYYKVSLNTSTHAFSIEPYEGTVKTFDGVCLSGNFNSWGDEAMTAFNSFDGAENHIWVLTYTFDTDDEVKFKMAGSWDYNWGTPSFPYGTGVNNGKNIPVTAGTYTIYFNDITGQYTFMKQ